jgi:hypothetical protein
MGTGVGDWATYVVNVQQAGNYRIEYFLAQTGSGPIIRTLVDTSQDLTNCDLYMNIDWRWARTDTLRGNWHYLDEGTHVIRYEITGRNPSSNGWQVVPDQIVMEWQSPVPPCQPLPVTGVVTRREANAIRLSWQGATEDTCGNAILPTTYDVYFTTRVDSAYTHLAQVPGNLNTYLDNRPFQKRVYYVVCANAGEAARVATQINVPSAPSVKQPGKLGAKSR